MFLIHYYSNIVVYYAWWQLFLAVSHKNIDYYNQEPIMTLTRKRESRFLVNVIMGSYYNQSLKKVDYLE